AIATFLPVELVPAGPEEACFLPRDPDEFSEFPVRGKVQHLEPDVPLSERLDGVLAVRGRDDRSTASLHPHPRRDHPGLILHHREGAALTPEGESARARADLPEDESTVVPDLDMDLDIRIVQIDADLGMVPSDVFPELAGQILTREGMGPHSPRTEGERLACREG